MNAMIGITMRLCACSTTAGGGSTYDGARILVLVKSVLSILQIYTLRKESIFEEIVIGYI